jgi:hypothetical protein
VRVQPSWELDKSAASRGQTQRVRKEFHEFEQGKREKPPDLPVKVQLQNVLLKNLFKKSRFSKVETVEIL